MDSVDKAFEDLTILRRCVKHIHFFSPGIPGVELYQDAGRCVELNHWSLITTGQADPQTITTKMFHEACRIGRADVVESLVRDYNQNPNALQYGNWSSLHTAMAHNQEEVVRVLIQLGANKIRTKDGVYASGLRPDLWRRCGGKIDNYSDQVLTHYRKFVNENDEQYEDSEFVSNIRVILKLITGLIFRRSFLEVREFQTNLGQLLCRFVNRFGPISLGTTPNQLSTSIMGMLVSQKNSYSLTRLCIELGLNITNNDKYLWISVNGEFYDKTQLLLQHGANVNSEFRDEITLLSRACQLNNPEMVQLLLDYGANSESTAPWYSKIVPLHFACQVGNPQIVRILLKHNAFPDVRNDELLTPLEVACSIGNVSCARLLLSAGEPWQQHHRDKIKPLKIACKHDHVNCVRLLFDYAIESEQYDDENAFLILYTACYSKSVKCVRFLLEKGVDANIQDERDIPLLHHICKQKSNTEIMQLLLEHNADPNIVFRNKTPLFEACYNGQSEYVRLLIKHDAEPELGDYIESTPLYVSCNQGDAECVRQLLEHPVFEEGITNGKINLYLWAICRNGHDECLRLFLETFVIDCDNIDKRLLVSICNSKYRDISECLRLLLENGAFNFIDYQDETDNYKTALHEACLVKNVATIRVLLEHGADTTIRDSFGYTPQEAMYRSHTTVSLEIENLFREFAEKRTEEAEEVSTEDDSSVDDDEEERLRQEEEEEERLRQEEEEEEEEERLRQEEEEEEEVVEGLTWVDSSSEEEEEPEPEPKRQRMKGAM